jgi:hypothetical protein
MNAVQAELAGDEGRGEAEERRELRADVGKAHRVRVSDACGWEFLEGGPGAHHARFPLLIRRPISLLVNEC